MTQRRLDLVGLCCIGLAVYLGYVIYLGWNGGAVGNGSQTALDYAVGAGGVVVPVALALAGIGLILRPFLPSPKSVAVGVAAIAAGLLLALAAQTAGLGPAGRAPRACSTPTSSRTTAAAWERPSTGRPALSSSGSGLTSLAIVLLVSGTLMLTGRSVSDMVRAARRGAERAKRGTVGFATAIKESRVHRIPI